MSILSASAIFDPSVIETVVHSANAVDAGILLNQNAGETQVERLNKKAVGVLSIGSGISHALKFVSSYVLTAFKCIALCVATGVLSVVGSVFAGAASIIDTVRIVSKIKALGSRVQRELDHAIETDNYAKQREITLFTMSKWVDVTKNFFTLATAVVTIISLIVGMTIFSPAVITLVAVNFILFLASILISKLGKIDDIEKRHFPAKI